MINKSQGSTFGGEEDSNWSVFAKCQKVWDDNSQMPDADGDCDGVIEPKMVVILIIRI